MTMYACARLKGILHDLPLAAVAVVAFIVIFNHDGIYVLRKTSSIFKHALSLSFIGIGISLDFHGMINFKLSRILWSHHDRKTWCSASVIRRNFKTSKPDRPCSVGYTVPSPFFQKCQQQIAVASW